MRKRVIVSLAIGDSYLDMAYACINSARNFLKSDSDYAIFYGNIKDKMRLKLIEGVHLINIEEIMYSRISRSKLKKCPFLYREFKSIPFVYEDYIDYDLIFLDADSIVFLDEFSSLFDLVHKHSVLVFGAFKADDYSAINYQGTKMNLRRICADLGYQNIRNMGLNSGFVGRAGDSVGKEFACILNETIERGEICFPEGYYNDELYFMLSFQLATKNKDDKGAFVPHGVVCTTHGADIIDISGHHSVYKKLSGEGLIERPAIVHYVEKTSSKEYAAMVKSKLPSAYSKYIHGNILTKLFNYHI